MIEKYTFGSMTIDGQIYSSDLKIFPDHIISNWWRKEGHILNLEDIEDVLEAKPKIFIIGTGYSGIMKVNDNIRKHIVNQGITLIVEKTVDAWKTYNKLSQNQEVVAAFHVTC